MLYRVVDDEGGWWGETEPAEAAAGISLPATRLAGEAL